MFKYVMAGGIVVAALLLVVATRKDSPATTETPTTEAPRATARKPIEGQAQRPPHLEQIAKLTAQVNAFVETPVGRDALFARAKLYAEHKDYRNAIEDLRGLLRRKDVEGTLRDEAATLLRQTNDAQRQNIRR